MSAGNEVKALFRKHSGRVGGARRARAAFDSGALWAATAIVVDIDPPGGNWKKWVEDCILQWQDDRPSLAARIIMESRYKEGAK